MHAMTSIPEERKSEEYYLLGDETYKKFLKNGISEYISVCGHRDMGEHRIWKNAAENVYVCDCGCGFRSGRLGCLCLENKEEFYV